MWKSCHHGLGDGEDAGQSSSAAATTTRRGRDGNQDDVDHRAHPNQLREFALANLKRA